MKLSYYLKNPKKLIIRLGRNSFLRLLNDKSYLKFVWKDRMGYSLNLKKPQTYNEKLQWLKLYDRKPIYTIMVDKYEAKKYVASIIGEEYIIPTLGIWKKFDDINFDLLPNQFVLKCTHDSGGLVICRDKREFDKLSAKKSINSSLTTNYFWYAREWPYKNIEPRIIAETYIEDNKTKELRDYKFFCFNGIARALFVASDRQNKAEETKFDFFDMNFIHLDFRNGHPNAKKIPAKPERFDEMKMLAEKLSQNIPHVRVDFYESNKKVYFGELTFSHWSGFVPFEPKEWDYIFGSWINFQDI